MPPAPKREARGRTAGRAGAVLLAVVLFGLLGVAQAHITGVFLYFLKDVQGQAGQSSLGILKAQLDQTHKRIAALEPQVAQARERYQTEAANAKRKVLFYDQYASEGFGAVVLGAKSPIDALADAETLRTVVARDMRQLQATATAYQALVTKETELTGYQALLKAFAEAETRHTKALGAKKMQDQEMALYNISEAWEEVRTGPLTRYVAWADQRLRSLPTIATRPQPHANGLQPPAGAPAGAAVWTIAEADLNGAIAGDHVPVDGIQSIHYYLRADHTYIVAHVQVPLGEHQLILVGQWSREGPLAVRYHVEYALVDGYLIDPQDPQMQQLIADKHMLVLHGTDLAHRTHLLQYQQDTGRLWLYLRAG